MPAVLTAVRTPFVSRATVAFALVMISSSSARAHPGTVIEPHDLASAWTFDVWVVLIVLLPALLYAAGVSRLWKSAGKGRGVRYGQAVCFAAGTFTMALALISPLDALGAALFSAHMTQHQLLMISAPPLLLLGSPSVAFLWALPMRHRGLVAHMVRTMSRSRLWTWLSHPAVAWSLHAAAIWLWHMPELYERTLFSDSMHALQHFFFTASAVLFWWTILHAHGVGVRGRGSAILSLFTTAAHTSVLGALLTLSSTPWYLAYAGRTAAWGFTLLEDQQLGGLIMWVPGGIVYTAAALIVTGTWLRHIERSASRRPADVSTASV